MNKISQTILQTDKNLNSLCVKQNINKIGENMYVKLLSYEYLEIQRQKLATKLIEELLRMRVL